ncbi:hypothetical protein ACWDZ4_31910 [Streptomyces sp. NPDC003016]
MEPARRTRPLRDGLNRALLALLGAAALAAGTWLAVTGPAREVPPWWPLPGEGLRPSVPDWGSPAVIALAGAVTAASFGWLVAQGPGRGPRRLALAHPALHLRTRTLVRAVRTEAEAVPGVVRARVRLSGRAARPRLAMAVLLEPEARPAAVLERLAGEQLRAARTAAGRERLVLSVRFRVRGHRTGRAR